MTVFNVGQVFDSGSVFTGGMIACEKRVAERYNTRKVVPVVTCVGALCAHVCVRARVCVCACVCVRACARVCSLHECLQTCI